MELQRGIDEISSDGGMWHQLRHPSRPVRELKFASRMSQRRDVRGLSHAPRGIARRPRRKCQYARWAGESTLDRSNLAVPAPTERPGRAFQQGTLQSEFNEMWCHVEHVEWRRGSHHHREFSWEAHSYDRSNEYRRFVEVYRRSSIKADLDLPGVETRQPIRLESY